MEKKEAGNSGDGKGDSDGDGEDEGNEEDGSWANRSSSTDGADDDASSGLVFSVSRRASPFDSP